MTLNDAGSPIHPAICLSEMAIDGYLVALHRYGNRPWRRAGRGVAIDSRECARVGPDAAQGRSRHYFRTGFFFAAFLDFLANR